MMWSETDLAYMAGLVDGEGWIGIVSYRRGERTYHRLDVAVNMVDPRPILWVVDTFGGVFRRFEAQKVEWSPVFRVVLTARKAAAMLEAIRPYMKVKGEVVDLALQFDETLMSNRGFGRSLSESVVAQREDLKQRISVMNHLRREVS